MLTFAFVLVGSYLLGSIPFGCLAGRSEALTFGRSAAVILARRTSSVSWEKVWLSSLCFGFLERFGGGEDCNGRATGIDFTRACGGSRSSIRVIGHSSRSG